MKKIKVIGKALLITALVVSSAQKMVASEGKGRVERYGEKAFDVINWARDVDIPQAARDLKEHAKNNKVNYIIGGFLALAAVDAMRRFKNWYYDAERNQLNQMNAILQRGVKPTRPAIKPTRPAVVPLVVK